MKITDAAKILDMTGTITPDAAKEAYRKAAKKYHPDRNPAGAEMMKLGEQRWSHRRRLRVVPVSG